MGSIKLPHGSGGSMSIAAPLLQPTGDLELKLPSTIGAAGEVVQNSTTAGTLEMGSPFRPAFSAYTSSSFDIAPTSDVKALFQTELFDTDGAYNTSTSTFTVPANMGGAYQINAQVTIDDINDATHCKIRLFIDGSWVDNFRQTRAYSAGADKIVSVSYCNVIKLNANQTVNIYMYHDSAGTQSSEDKECWFSMFRLGGVAT